MISSRNAMSTPPPWAFLSFNFLGLIMDEHLNWKSHVEKNSNKCSNAIGVLNKLNYVFTTNS